MIAHVVAVDAPALAPVVEELARIAEAHGAQQVHAGANAAPEAYAGQAALALVAVFADRASLQAYLDDPAHQDAAARLGGAAVTVIDLERTLA